MIKSLVALSILLPFSSTAWAHNAPFARTAMQSALTHVLIHALYALPLFLGIGVALYLVQRTKSKYER